MSLEDSLMKSKIKNDKAYVDSLNRSRKAYKDYDSESAKYVSEGFPKSREKTLRSLGLELSKADGDYQRELRRMKKECREQARTSIRDKYGVSF